MKRRPLTTSADKPSSPAAEVARPDVRGADAVLTIDLAAIVANYRFLRQAAHPATCAAVVKADAYGLGVGKVAPALQDAGCAWFFVATLDEGIALRDILGPASRIGILNGLAAGCERVCWRASLTPVINTAAQYRAYAELAGQVEARLPVILQFDTGMTRLGLSEAEALALAAAPSQRLAPVVVMSHLACAPTRDHPANAAQLAAFQRIGALFPGVDRSLAASSGIFLGAGYHVEMVRPGAALFGISPCPGQAMRPVVRVQGRVMQMREVPEGTAVADHACDDCGRLCRWRAAQCVASRGGMVRRTSDASRWMPFDGQHNFGRNRNRPSSRSICRSHRPGSGCRHRRRGGGDHRLRDPHPARPSLRTALLGAGAADLMRVLVLGSGVVGVASAYYLAKAGHEVVVVDRQAAAGMETSFANAGQVSPGYATPWAGPGIPMKALKWLAMRHRPLVVWPLPEPRLYFWLAQMLANCTEDAFRRNKGRMLGLAEYSRDCLRALRAETGIAYDHREQGTLQLFRTAKQLDAAAHDTAVLDTHAIRYELLDRAGCVACEPALRFAKSPIVGGLRLPGDETGDALKFTQALAAICAALGVEFRYGTDVEALLVEQGRVVGVATGQGQTITADAYVVAMGSFTPRLLRPLGIAIPVYPVKGYSLTAPIQDLEGAPVSTVMDETYKIAITRLGDRIRVGGTAELAGFSSALRGPRRTTLEHSVADLFPRSCDLKDASFWTGLRPMTPDGTPIVGATRIPNLYTNTGHGTLGWTMACGSGRVLADLMSGRPPEIDIGELGMSRYGSDGRVAA
jgi:D-amino-acid dehydrogenase